MPWRRGDQVTFEVDDGQQALWVDMLVFDQLPDDRVSNPEPARRSVTETFGIDL